MQDRQLLKGILKILLTFLLSSEKKISESFSAFIFNRWNCQARVEQPCLGLEYSNQDLGMLVKERWQNSKHAESCKCKKNLYYFWKLISNCVLSSHLGSRSPRMWIQGSAMAKQKTCSRMYFIREDGSIFSATNI